MKKYATLRPLAPEGVKDVRKGFQKMLSSLRRFDGEGRIQFRILGRRPERWLLELYPGRRTVKKAEAKDPDFELLTRKETWNAIASGRLSPAEAYLQGKLRVRGNVEFGRRVFQRLAAPGGDFEIC